MVIHGPEYSRVPRAIAGFPLQSGSPSLHIHTQNSGVESQAFLEVPRTRQSAHTVPLDLHKTQFLPEVCKMK